METPFEVFAPQCISTVSHLVTMIMGLSRGFVYTAVGTQPAVNMVILASFCFSALSN